MIKTIEYKDSEYHAITLGFGRGDAIDHATADGWTWNVRGNDVEPGGVTDAGAEIVDEVMGEDPGLLYLTRQD